MPIIWFFLVMTIIASPMAMHLGDQSNVLYNNVSGDYGGMGFLYFAGLVVGAVWFLRSFYLKYDSTTEPHRDKLGYKIDLGISIALCTIGFSYVYGFTVAPFTNGGIWNGWLIIMLIGLIPMLLHINDEIRYLIETYVLERPKRNDNHRIR